MILVVDDEKLIRSSLERALQQLGLQAESAGSLADAEIAIARRRYDVVVLDLKLGDGNGFDLLRHLRHQAPDTKVVVITAQGNNESADAAMKLGAFDFVNKPFELDEILTTAQNALRAVTLERRAAYHAVRDRHKLDAVPGLSPAMRALEAEIAAVAPQPVQVILIVGETGSGKALVARRLHYGAGARADGPFVELNAAAIPETLVESELFGHERGAFSDARQRKLGLVEVADGGTLFLDEVGDFAPAAQAKLLSFLESFSFRRVGATASRWVDTRVVAATNRDLEQLMKEGRFRADLYYRLSAFVLKVPPLRERREDIPALADHFVLADAHRFSKHFHGVSEAAATRLAGCRWPGNVRELKAVIQRAVLMHDAEQLEPEHLPDLEAIVPVAPADAEARIPTLEQVELRYMRAVLERMGGNKLRAAEKLGITRQTLAKRLGESE